MLKKALTFLVAFAAMFMTMVATFAESLANLGNNNFGFAGNNGAAFRGNTQRSENQNQLDRRAFFSKIVGGQSGGSKHRRTLSLVETGDDGDNDENTSQSEAETKKNEFANNTNDPVWQ